MVSETILSRITSLANLIYNETEDGANTHQRVGEYAKRVATVLGTLNTDSIRALIKYFKKYDSLDDLPTSPTATEKLIGYLVDDECYLYVGENGDTLDGLYENVPLAEMGKNYVVDQINNLLIVTADDEEQTQYACHVDEYVIPSKPTFSTPSGATTSASRTLTIACATSGVTIYYTKDGSTPTSKSNVYTGTITISASTATQRTTTTIKAIAIKNGLTSDVASLDVVTSRHLAVPTVVADGDDYALASVGRNVTISCETSNVTLYYTLDGTTPTERGDDFDSAFKITKTTTIKVLAVANSNDWESETCEKTITVGKLSMWWDLLAESASAPTTEAEIVAFSHQIKKDALPQTLAKITDTTQKKVCFAYSSSLANLTSIKDQNGTDYLVNFNGPVTVGNFKVYTMKSAANQANQIYTFN